MEEKPNSSVLDKKKPMEPLFELTHLASKLTIDKIFLNGQHCVRSFQIKNIHTQPLVVKLRSNLKAYFQIENTNMSKNLIDRYQSSLIVTNTVESAIANRGKGNGLGGYIFDEFMNAVNYIDELPLAVEEEVTLFLVLKTDVKATIKRVDLHISNEQENEIQHEIQDANGMIFLFAYKQDDNKFSSGVDLNLSFNSDATVSPLFSSLYSTINSGNPALKRNYSLNQGSPLESPMSSTPDYQVNNHFYM